MLFIAVAIVGLADASYLTYEHYVNPFGGCTLGGCQEVTTSEYSVVFGSIPISLLGVFYYLTVLTGAILYWILEKETILKALSVFTISGLFASIYFVYLQIAVIGAVCPFCMLSALTSSLLFAVGMFYLWQTKKFSNK